MSKNNPSLSFGIGVRFFISVMIVSVLGILLKFPITFPNQLFFNRTIEYTSTHYSYKPGQNGWTYNFFALNNDGLFNEVSLAIVLLLALLFYFGILSAITIFLNLKEKRIKAAQRDLILVTIIAFIFFVLPKIYSIDSFFNINEKGTYYAQDHIYTSNNTTWEIGHQHLKGVHIKEHTTISNDSSLLVIKRLDKNQSSILFSEKLALSGKTVKTFTYNDTLWIFSKKLQYLKAYNMITEKLIIKDKDDLIRMMPKGYNAGIANLDYSPARKFSIYINTNDGHKLYLHTNHNIITKNYMHSNYNENNEYFLKRVDRSSEHRTYLRPRIYTDTIASQWNEKVFIDAKIINYDKARNVIIISAKPNIKKETKPTITAYTLDKATQLWQINEKNAAFINKINSNLNAKAFIRDNMTILNIYTPYYKGSIHVNNQGDFKIVESNPTF